MALLPTAFMRTTQNMISGSLLGHLGSSSNDLFVTQEQLSTGRSILAPSMNALGTTEFLNYQSRTFRNTTYQSSVSDLKSGYNIVDSQLGEAGDIINSLKQIALRESNDGASDTQTRSLSATEVSNLRNAILTLANSRYKGLSLFAGQNTGRDAFSAFGDALRYNGTRNVNKRLIEDGMTFDQTLTVERVFGELQTASAARVDMNASLDLGVVSPPGQPQVATPLSALNDGRGVDLGILSIAVMPNGQSNPTGALSYQVDLREAKTIADVAEAFNNVTGADGNTVFSVDVYSGGGVNWPQDGSNSITGLRITATGEVATAIVGKPAQIEFSSQPGRTTAADLGLVTGQTTYQTTNGSLAAAFGNPAAAGTFNQTYTLDLEVAGTTLSMSVAPAGLQDIADLASTLQTQMSQALSTAGMFDFSVAVSTTDSDSDGNDDSLVFDVTDDSGTGGFRLSAPTGSSLDSVAIADAFAQGTLTQAVAFNRAEAGFTGGIFAGRDLNPGLSLNTSLTTLNGGAGFQLETTDSGGVPATISPQGIRVTNGSLSADINLADIINDSTKTVGDLLNRINGAGVEVEARISDSGDRIEIVSKLTGVPLKIENLNGTLATQMGVDTRFGEMRINDLNDGNGLTLSDGADFRAITASGVAVEFDIGEPATVQDIVDAINANTANALPAGGAAFTAKAVTERTFTTSAMSAAVLGATANFQVSLNGMAPRAIQLNSAGAALSLDQMAVEMENALTTLASEMGLSGYTVRVNGNNLTGKLELQVQDENGPAEIDFIGGDTEPNYGLDGSVDAQGVRSLDGEVLKNRFVLQDNSFNTATWQPGMPTPILQNLGTSSVLEDMGLVTSDAQRRQALGGAATIAFPVVATSVDFDFARGATVNVALGGETTLDQVAETLQTGLRAGITAQGIAGLGVAVRVDSSTGALLVEVVDGFTDATVTISGAGAASLALDAANVTLSSPATVVFNNGTSSYEGRTHALRGTAADNIFTAVNDLITALQADSPVAVANTLDMLDNALERFLDSRNEAGARVRRLDLADNRLTNENTQLQEMASSIMDADLAALATRMAQQQALFQAGIAATARIMRISVLDYL